MRLDPAQRDDYRPPPALPPAGLVPHLLRGPGSGRVSIVGSAVGLRSTGRLTQKTGHFGARADDRGFMPFASVPGT